MYGIAYTQRALQHAVVALISVQSLSKENRLHRMCVFVRVGVTCVSCRRCRKLLQGCVSNWQLIIRGEVAGPLSALQQLLHLPTFQLACFLDVLARHLAFFSSVRDRQFLTQMRRWRQARRGKARQDMCGNNFSALLSIFCLLFSSLFCENVAHVKNRVTICQVVYFFTLFCASAISWTICCHYTIIVAQRLRGRASKTTHIWPRPWATPTRTRG